MASPDSFGNFRGRIDLATGQVTELYPVPGQAHTWYGWKRYKETKLLQDLRALDRARDITSDLEWLPGKKPLFEDDWYGILPPRVPPNPLQF